MSNQLEKCKAFAELHQQTEAWLIPNPWDIGSARVLQGLGFKALATTSSGFAFTLGRADGAVTLEEKLAHCRGLTKATSIPINADFENGFTDHIASMQDNIRRMVDTGIAGYPLRTIAAITKQFTLFRKQLIVLPRLLMRLRKQVFRCY